MSIDNTQAAPAAASGVSRRKVIKAAAWSAPVIAMAVSTPLAAASTTFESPTAYVTGTLTANGTNATVRTAVYSGGALTYNSAGYPGIDSGDLTLSFINSKTGSWTLDTADLAAQYAAQGWVLVTNTPALITFIHAPISNGGAVAMPSVSWTAPVGSTKPVIAIKVSSDSDDVSGLGLELS